MKIEQKNTDKQHCYELYNLILVLWLFVRRKARENDRNKSSFDSTAREIEIIDRKRVC